MKHETNNEIDLLLRRMGRRDGDSVGDADKQINDGHLDTDELSSYAQNALPPATRARYTEHLAECSTCRKLITQLSLSLGATAGAPIETAPAPGGLKAFLASLFSPMVLRYAVPALGLIVVAAIGFVLLRQQRLQEFTARVQDQKRNGVSTPQPATSVTAPQTDESLRGQPESESQSPRKPSKEDSREAAPERKAARDAAGPAPAPLAKDQRAETQTQAVAEAPPPAASKIAEARAYEAQKREDAAAKKQSEPGVQNETVDVVRVPANRTARADERRAAQPGTADAEQAKAKPTPSEKTHGFIGGVASVGSRKRAQEDKSDAETRSIAGRSFRNERGIWIDTEYDSSLQTVNMARGSDQFRALVADEPAIGTIAKQLNGEVIVVWKGRAYRIR